MPFACSPSHCVTCSLIQCHYLVYVVFCCVVCTTQVQFHADLQVINQCLDQLIANARATRQEDDLEALQARDYTKVSACVAEVCVCVGGGVRDSTQMP